MPTLRLLALAFAVAALFLTSPADAQRRRAVRAPAGDLDVFPLAGDDPTIPSNADLEPLRQVIGDASVVALGESYHTSGGFYRLKHRVFRYLVEELGFRAFAIESDWEPTERTNTYVQTGEGTAEQAARFSHVVWQSSEYADLVRWMWEWNRTHPAPADRLTLFGFDIQQPSQDGPGLAMFLLRLGIPSTDPRSNGLRSCEGAFGVTHPFGEIPPDRHAACMQALDAIELHLEANRDDIVRRTSESEFTVAMLRVKGLRAWEESAFIIAHDFAAGFNPRDEIMAYAFHVQRARKAPGAKTMVWAANIHVAQALAPRGELPMGSYLEETLGEDFVSFALTAFDAEIDFPGYTCGSQARSPGSVEGRLAGYGHEALLARPRAGVPNDDILPMGLDLLRPWRVYDGVLFLMHSPRMHPLAWAPCGTGGVGALSGR